MSLLFYFLLTISKSLSKVRSFWDWMKNKFFCKAATAWNRRIHWNFSKHWSNCFCFGCFSIFDILYQIWFQNTIFLDIKLEVSAHEAETTWSRVILLQNHKIANRIVFVLCTALLFYLMYQKRLSEVRSFDIKKICWSMRQIQPETGESLVIFF